MNSVDSTWEREGMNSVDSTCVELDHKEPLPSLLCITSSQDVLHFCLKKNSANNDNILSWNIKKVAGCLGRECIVEGERFKRDNLDSEIKWEKINKMKKV